MRQQRDTRELMANAIMVTGGSGFVGQTLVRALAERSRTVVSLYNHKVPDAQEGVYPVCSDLASPELIAAPLRGVETVVHLAWSGALAGPSTPLPRDPMREGDGLTPNLRYLRNVLTAMERAGTQRIVFVSAIGANAQAESGFLKEKYFGEILTLNSRIPERIVVRSSVLWGGGPSDMFLQVIKRMLQYAVYPLPRRDLRMAPLHVRDLSAILAKVATSDLRDAAGVLEVDGGESYRMEELLKLVSAHIIGRTQFGIGGLLGRALLRFIERDSKGTGPQIGSCKLRHFLQIQRAGDNSILSPGNHLLSLLPEKLPSFRERLLGSSADSGKAMPQVSALQV